jgi:hypothetical protein
VQAYDQISCRGFGKEGGIARIGLAGDERRRAEHAQRGADIVEELACRLWIHVHPAHATEAVEHHVACAGAPRRRHQLVAGRFETVRQELLQAQELDHISDQFVVVEGEGAQVCDELARRLGERGKHHRLSAIASRGEGHLIGKRRLAAARRANDDHKGAPRNPSTENQIKIRHPGRIN